MRQIVLDTETTGLETRQNHRIIEIGAVEVINRRATGRTFHQYINPEREIDEGAREVHGISNEDLADKPVFAEVVDDFIEFVEGAELIIHNAPFDVGFIDHELSLLETNKTLHQYCQVVDTLVMARKMHPGQRVSLDALCRRYGIDNSQREKHGALLDAELLAEVYLAMTGGQVHLGFSGQENNQTGEAVFEIRRIPADRPPLRVLRADSQEIEAHRERLQAIEAKSGRSVWKQSPAN